MIAHIRKSDYQKQSVQDHLESVALFSKRFGGKAAFSSMAELAGLLHDMGKNTDAFRNYIENAVRETGVPLERIDHSTAGAKYLYETYYINSPSGNNERLSNYVVEIVGMCILSHHSGLQNFVQEDGAESDFFRRVYSKDLPYYEEARTTFLNERGNEERVKELLNNSIEEMRELLLNLNELAKGNPGSVSPTLFFSLASIYIFSCLIDADRTDARRFDEGDTSELTLSYESFFKESYEKLIERLKDLAATNQSADAINQLRADMSERCDKLAEAPSSIYKLSIPTGGGKTLASLRYALKHAQKYRKDRIIYIVPYTTILEQNAEAVREVVADGNMVLEHHANVISDDIDEDDEFNSYERARTKQLKLARDNWDSPVIFTTLVQFLDTFYAKGTRKVRRLHNLTNSVIIFDEVQTVPIKHIPLFNSAVNFLHYIGKSSILLCTATQPSLKMTSYPLLIGENSEIVSDLTYVAKSFERVTIKNEVTAEGWDAGQIAEFAIDELQDKQSILIILNTKTAVLNVYQQLKNFSGAKIYHLSTSMCPNHRMEKLNEIRAHLGPDKKEKVICVSSQLIEAGVDVDFSCVIRSLAGLDSIAQAAGRCNRNGRLEKGIVYIIKAKEENLDKLPEIQLGQKVMMEDILTREQLAKDLLSPKAIETYFDYYLVKAEREIKMTDDELKVPLIELIDRSRKYVAGIPRRQKKTAMVSMFKSLHSKFKVIDDRTTGVIVPYNDEAEDVIARLNGEIYNYHELNQLLKKAQQYSVNVYNHTLAQLSEADLIYPLFNEGIYAIRDDGYDKQYGLSLAGEGKWDLPIY